MPHIIFAPLVHSVPVIFHHYQGENAPQQWTATTHIPPRGREREEAGPQAWARVQIGAEAVEEGPAAQHRQPATSGEGGFTPQARIQGEPPDLLVSPEEGACRDS